MKYFVSYAKNIGTYHVKYDIPCQDCTYAKTTENRAIAIVSDGAGSKTFAKETAEILVKALVRLFDKDLLKYNIEHNLLFNELASKIREADMDIEEMAATIVFVYVDGADYYCGHMGDGGIILLKDKKSYLLSAPENGEYLNETFFFPSSDETHFRIKSGKITGETTFILSSDGVFDLLFDTDTQQAMEACKTLESWNVFEDNANELIKNSLQKVLSKHSNDDQSIAILSVK